MIRPASIYVHYASLFLGAACVLVTSTPESVAQVQVVSREDQIVSASIQTLNEVMAIPAQSIPANLLAGAEGVAIIPNVVKGGFILGARFGRGVILVRDENRGWHAPLFITLTGGSVGWQAGVQSTDVVLVFRTRRSIDGILTRRFTLGVDASAAAGPVGRQASAATDIQMQSEILSYARSRGLFLGASLDGSMIEVDQMANASYYRSPAPGQPAVVPPMAIQLVQLVASLSPPTGVPVDPATIPPATQPLAAQPAVPAGTPLLAQQYSAQESDVLRDQLSKTSPELFERLDPAWTSFLALPAEVFTPGGHPPLEAIDQSLARFDMVATDPRYQALNSMPAFQSTYGLLRHYASTLRAADVIPQLPPPPVLPQ
ncbi:lipid-binding SYLF domain-containing protein [Aeoliella sp. SH292]|uniref:lipid-binding SYLF domain-containing protein n=1 Tax=Aeoliella sp. SH292 TaxID=3454464 RepID=UPI003F9E06C2